ncbi:integral membrane protein [Moniliophthora roreri MCA 2997]|uniref:Integral membrane protein n=1 Tax=Moniliophthora roreri (strain MCA 2997) TaxID=1381753 RepID=V2XFH3_MONRO|nr:integral membrane protein [Moniliophthora roreri MCA 2997]KAI3622553.1 integral membrane protein [Moniliophthora roreri]
MSAQVPVVTKGPHPLLVKYLAQLNAHPLRTKAITTAILCFLQEVVANHIARTSVKRVSKDGSIIEHLLARARVDGRAFKMALYGFLVSAPMGHFLVGSLQKAFAGKTGAKARVAQIVCNNFLISPIQACAYLTSMAIISGARSKDEIIKTIKSGFFSVVRITWVVSPLSMTIAQRYIPLHLWVPFFNAIQFVLGTYFNVRVKKLRKQQEHQD